MSRLGDPVGCLPRCSFFRRLNNACCRVLAAGPSNRGEPRLQDGIEAGGAELQRLTGDLLALYLEYKRGQLEAAVVMYLARWEGRRLSASPYVISLQVQ
jgi:hypothetical protein